MTLLTVTFGTPTFEPDNFSEIIRIGALLSIAGLLSLKWEEFPAPEAARENGLHDVVWEAVRDDTPGTLTCVIRSAPLLPTGLQA